MREKILELLRQRPFQPFRVQLSNGGEHIVRHPEQAMLASGYLFIGIPVGDSPGPDVSDVAFVALIHIVELNPLTSKAPTSSN